MIDLRAITVLIDSLEALDVPYMVVGALSSNTYGVSRGTKDADVVVEFQSGDLNRLLEKMGDGFSSDRQLGFELITATTRYLIKSVATNFSLELFQLSDDPFDQERFQRRLRLHCDPLNREVFVPTAEDVVIMKLRWGRPKDREDARDVMAVQGDRLDWKYIGDWCERHGTRELLEEIRRSIPPDDVV